MIRYPRHLRFSTGQYLVPASPQKPKRNLPPRLTVQISPIPGLNRPDVLLNFLPLVYSFSMIISKHSYSPCDTVSLLYELDHWLYIFWQNSPVPFQQRLARHLHKSSVCWIYSLQCQCEPVLHYKPDVWNQCFRWEPFLSYMFLKTASNAPTDCRLTCCQCLPSSLFSKQKCFNKSNNDIINAKCINHWGKM